MLNPILHILPPPVASTKWNFFLARENEELEYKRIISNVGRCKFDLQRFGIFFCAVWFFKYYICFGKWAWFCLMKILWNGHMLTDIYGLTAWFECLFTKFLLATWFSHIFLEWIFFPWNQFGVKFASVSLLTIIHCQYKSDIRVLHTTMYIFY